MFIDLLSQTVGEERAKDLLAVLEVDERLDSFKADTVRRATIAGALHFLLFEELLKRAPTALAVAAEAIEQGDKLTLDHAAMATIDSPHLGALARGRHHLGQILEPLGFVQMEAHALSAQNATAHIYRFQEGADLVPDFVVLEVHALRFDAPVQAAAKSVFGDSPTPNHVRVQALVKKLGGEEELTLEEAKDLLQGLFAWFGRQHVPPLKSDYEALAKASDVLAWMAHEGQGLSHMTLRVPHLSATMDVQLRGDRELQVVKTSLDQSTRLVGFVPDRGPRPFRGADGGITQLNVPIANLAFIERGEEAEGARFEPSLF